MVSRVCDGYVIITVYGELCVYLGYTMPCEHWFVCGFLGLLRSNEPALTLVRRVRESNPDLLHDSWLFVSLRYHGSLMATRQGLCTFSDGETDENSY